MASSAVDFEQVFEQELRLIATRRQRAGLEKAEADVVDTSAVKEDLSGLALSGGGVRSGAFCLGVLQALYGTGKLKLIDYLSTVSGGGYAGALFSSAVHQLPSEAPLRAPASPNSASQLDFANANPSDCKQPERVYQLSLHGRMMGNVLRFMSRHFSGLIASVELNRFVSIKS